jgi:hypothetical protein
MVGNGEQPLEKTAEEIQREAEKEIARTAHLARELDQARNRGKKHNGMQDDSGALDNEPRDAAPHKETLLEVQFMTLGKPRSTLKLVTINLR